MWPLLADFKASGINQHLCWCSLRFHLPLVRLPAHLVHCGLLLSFASALVACKSAARQRGGLLDRQHGVRQNLHHPFCLRANHLPRRLACSNLAHGDAGNDGIVQMPRLQLTLKRIVPAEPTPRRTAGNSDSSQFTRSVDVFARPPLRRVLAASERLMMVICDDIHSDEHMCGCRAPPANMA